MSKRDPELDACRGTICTPTRMKVVDGKYYLSLILMLSSLVLLCFCSNSIYVVLVVPVVFYILHNPHGLGVSAESTTFLRYSSGAERSSLCVER